MSDMNDRKQLREICDKATQGDWWIDSHGHRMMSHENGDTIFVTFDKAMGPAVRNPETGNLSHWPNDWDASYIVAAQPKVVRGLLDEIDRLNALVIEREVVRIGQSLQRHDDQKQMDELVALGIQQDKDEIARLREENARWRKNYEHLIEQHMPRTGHGCEEGWSRVVEARELQAQVDQLKAENAELKAQTGKSVGPLTLGLRGKAFDPPGTHRAYTYAEQPNNQGAWRLGEALVEAHRAPAGDHIDGGLGLLKSLQLRGFGVFEMDRVIIQEQQQ